MAATDLLFHVLNLERREDRRAQFRHWNAETPGLRFEFVKAVDSIELDVEQVRRATLLTEDAQIPAGHLACALSHRSILLKAQSEERPFFICEDDAVFRLDFYSQWMIILSQLPTDWDIVLFGYNFDSAISMELIPGVQSFLSAFDNKPIDSRMLSQFRQCFQGVLLRRLANAFGTLAYAVSPKGAEKLLNSCFPLRNDVVPIPCLHRAVRAFSLDCLMNKYYRDWNAYAAFPPLAVTPNDKLQSDTSR